MVAVRLPEQGLHIHADVIQMSLTHENGNVLWQSALRALVGELGDKTFWLSVLLSTFCPWEGVRDASRLEFQQFLVFLGCVIGLVAHVAMLSLFPAEDLEFWLQYIWVPEIAAGALLLLLCFRTYLHHVSSSEESSSAEAKEDEDVPSYRKDAFSLPVLGNGDSSEGGLAGFLSSADNLLGERFSDQSFSTVLGFIAAAVLAFAAEAEDKSWYALMEAGQPSIVTVLGAALGFLPAVLCAVLMSHFFWFQLEPKSVRLLAMLLCLVLGLCCLSQACMHLSVLDPPYPSWLFKKAEAAAAQPAPGSESKA